MNILKGESNKTEKIEDMIEDDALQEAIFASLSEQQILGANNFKNLPESGFNYSISINFY